MSNLYKTIVASILFFMPLSVFAALAHTKAEAEENIERIEVTGDWHISTYRKEMKKAEQAFYTMYNKLTPDIRMQFECIKQRVGSIVTKRVCQPKYLTRLKHTYNKDTIADAKYGIRSPQRLKELETYRKRHAKHITNLVSNNPELFEKLVEYKAAKDTFEKKHIEFRENFSLFDLW